MPVDMKFETFSQVAAPGDSASCSTEKWCLYIRQPGNRTACTYWPGFCTEHGVSALSFSSVHSSMWNLKKSFYFLCAPPPTPLNCIYTSNNQKTLTQSHQRKKLIIRYFCKKLIPLFNCRTTLEQQIVLV